MKTNGVLTLSPFRGKVKLKRSVHRVIDPDGAVIGGVSAYNVYDLNGDKIAALTHVEKRSDGEIRRYEGHRVFHLKNNILTLENGGVLGRVIIRKERRASVPIVVALSVLIAAIFAIVAVLGFPVTPVSGDERPVLTIRSEGGKEWGANQDLQVFSGKLYPGKEGSYAFEIENPTEYEMEYVLTLSSTKSWTGRSPIEYRVRMNNVYIGDTNGWTLMEYSDDNIQFNGIRFTPQSSHIITIEWRWPFESGNDESDTEIGESGFGDQIILYTLNIDVSAFIVGQE